MTAAGARVATPALIRQHVRELRAEMEDRTHPEPFITGIKAAPIWNHGTLDDPIVGTIHVEACPSPLAARRAMAELGAEIADADHEPQNLVILTNVTEAELGADLLSRFVRPKLHGLSPWDAVRQRFGVTTLDPRFNDPLYHWMAEPLLDVPKESLRAGAVTLSTDAALRAVTRSLLGAERPTVESLLTATADPTFVSRVETIEPQIVTNLCHTLATVLGPAGALVAGAINNGRGERCLAAGLAARTVAGNVAGSAAQARIEMLTGVDTITDAALDAWASAAERVFREIDTGSGRRDLLDNLDHTGTALAAEWKVPHPDASDLLTISFEKRLDQLADVLTNALDGSDAVDVDRLRDAVKRIEHHRLARDEEGRHRARTAVLAARLTAWLRDPASKHHGTGVDTTETTPLGLTESIRAYVADGAWVDWARRRVGGGDHGPENFAAVLARISELAHTRRAEGNRRYAEALARWSTHGTAADLDERDVTTVEAVIDKVVAPLAKKQPVLLIVLDGCGLGPFLEFADQFGRYGYREIGRDDRRQVALAALPTVTSVSRTSLLTGTPTVGASGDEKRDFPKHRKISSLVGPAAHVFHHAELEGGVGRSLPDDVLGTLGLDGPQAVAVVVNTIDDQLTKGDFTPEYRIQDLGPLPALLRAAAAAGRTLIVTADHGHVLGIGLDGRGQVIRSGEGGDRWRIADREPTEDEVHLRGPRVLLGDERGVLAPWHDDLRYSAKHGGYHGGATPDETIVPVAVYTPIGVDAPSGWAPLTVAPPAWWSLHVDPERAPESKAPATSPTRRRPRTAPDPDQAALFSEPTETVKPTSPTPVPPADNGAGSELPAAAPAWLDAVLASEIFQLQLSLNKRARLTVDEVRATLLALHTRGGVANYAVIAEAVGKPQSRIGRFLPNVANVLNVDGFGVLTVKQTANEAELDEILLRQQFLGDHR